MADVFISYSEGDASPLVKKIGDALNAAGISCWYMERDSKHGRFPEIIAKEIEDCAVFLLILNEKSNKSKHVKNEVGLAFELDKEIFPFRADGCKLSYYMRYYFTSFTITTANPPQEEDIRELVAQIADILGKDPPQSQPVRVEPDPPPAKIIKHGECGRDVTYQLNENGVLMFSGAGPMSGYPNIGENAPWWDERETVSCVWILNGVTSIGDWAFDGCLELENVYISDSVTSIGKYAFKNCSRLASVDIPDSVTCIEKYAFADCSGLVSVYISNSVSYIGNAAFQNCSGLTNVDIPDSVTSIEKWAFNGCYNLQSVSVSVELKIANDAFPNTTKVIRRPRK